MATAIVNYLGDIRTECHHVVSGATVIADAPTTHFGRGEYFSPLDLMVASYASCVITIMAIYCTAHNIPFEKASAEVTSINNESPIKINKLVIDLNLEGNNWSKEQEKRVIAAGKACPIALTLGDNVEIEFNYKI